MNGLGISSYSNFDNQEIISSSDTINFDELDKVYIDYLVDYIAQKSVQRDWSFSLMPTATACSFIPGGNGSKEEMLISLTITTINDFDDDHLANSNINDLFDYYGSYWERLSSPISLAQFLDGQTGNLQEEDLILQLKKAPEINQSFQIKVEMELSTGENYEFETAPIIIIP